MFNKSILNNINPGDLIFAFFPCTRFQAQVPLLSRCEANPQRFYNDIDKLMYSIDINNDIHYYYNILCYLCCIALQDGFKLIVENPYTQPHYLTQFFPFKPTIIDLDRRNDGDFYKKPTQYFFFNFKPANNLVFESVTYHEKINIRNIKGFKRSLISSEYANRFIRKFLIGVI